MDAANLMEKIDPTEYYWITCITQEPYLRGAKVLLKSLRMVGSKHQLIVMVTRGLSTELIMSEPNLILVEINPYTLPATVKTNYLFDRFSDVWNKLLCWTIPATKVCWLDADMLVMQNMDDVFDQIPSEMGLAACPGKLINHYC